MKIDLPIIVKKFNRHDEVKKRLLRLLDEQNYSSFKDRNDSITKTDWYVDVGGERKYWKFIYPYLRPTVLEICKNNLNYPDDVIKENLVTNCWFQQYHKNDSHSWHRHFFCSINVVYFVELPDDVSTEFMLPQSTETYRSEAKEGDLLFFPSFLMHRSPVNTSEKRKTIIAFNLA